MCKATALPARARISVTARQTHAALLAFAQLQQRDPPHVPSFLMGAQLLADLSRTEEARAVLRTGIEAARDQDNAHAASEMAELLASLGSG